MADSTKVSSYPFLAADRAVEDERWSPPQTAMFVTVVSAGLWTLILAGARWLIG
jgi:hypothetical protein